MSAAPGSLLQAPVSTEMFAFPAGGRPLEWRALEEAAAFEKWFQSGAKAPEEEVGIARDSSSPRASGAGAAQNVAPHAESQIQKERMNSVGDAPASFLQSTRFSAVDWDMRSASAGFSPAVRSTHMAHRMSSSSRADNAGIVPGMRWSALALTAAVAEGHVRIVLRDYRLTSDEIETLHRILIQDLLRLGYDLALFTVNGELRHAAQSESGGKQHTSVSSGGHHGG